MPSRNGHRHRGRNIAPYSEQARSSMTHAVRQKFPTYDSEHFRWDDIKSYLDIKFNYSWTAYNESKVGDQWLFDVPEALSEEDRDALTEARNKKNGQLAN